MIGAGARGAGGGGVEAGGAGGGARARVAARGGKKRTPVTFGCANIGIEGVKAAPVDFFIRKTNPNLKEEKIKESMVLCAALEVEGKPEKAELRLDDVKVKCLNNTKYDPNPRTKCWQITVPHLWREIMQNDESA